MIDIPVNKYQTPITEELLNSLPEEVQEGLISLLNTVPYIRNLISPNRRYARDLPRDEEGRIIVDLTNPHILEDMDYFRPTAIHFEKYGTLTNLTPNANRNSKYGSWLREERNRIWNGYVRPSDGEWVTGFMYFFLNYCPMKLTKIRKNSKIADRIEGLPEVWEGIYLRFHYIDQARKKGLHGAELASRGKGKSFSLASILTHNFVLGENSEAHKNITSLVIASNLEFLTKDGTITKFINMSDFSAQNTQFPRKRLKSSLQELTWRMGYMDAETMVAKGTKNEVIAVTSNDTISKIRGKRATFIGIEEFGSFNNLLSLYNILIPSVSEGDITFGLLFMLGTAGDKSSDFAGAQEIMYNPVGYNMHYVHNVYDKEGNGRHVFVYFSPGYINRKGCYNNDGVSDVVKALIEILMHRYKVKYNVTDHDTLPRIVAEVPITPAEAIMKVGVNMFPAADASEALQQLDNNPHWDSDIYVGELIFNKNNQVEFRPTGDIPIREYPLKNNKAVGAIEILKMPEKGKNSLAYVDRYIISLDPFDDDSSNTSSLGSIYVLDLWTDKYVARYTGRPSTAEGLYEIARRLCLFYNARLNYENNKKGTFAYFSKMNCLYLLTDTLEFLRDKDMIKENTVGNKSKGTLASAPINHYGLTLFKNYLTKPVTVIDNDGKESTIMNIYTIRDRALLKEIIIFNSVGNFDRISSNILLMLLREAKMITYSPYHNEENRLSSWLP
nr:MAG: terminase large subunit [Caudoviricetes sp.]